MKDLLTLVALQEQWCNSHGSVNEVRSKLHMRHEGAVKRERAIAYALSHQVYVAAMRGSPIPHLNLI